jgi:hypothetical protein
MQPYKPFEILVGSQGEGWADIAGIAVIAEIGKAKNSPLINKDDSDRTKANPINHKGDPFDSQSSLRAGSGTQREFLRTLMKARLRK